MEISEIRELVKLIEMSEIEEFEMERAGIRIRIRKQTAAAGLPAAHPAVGPLEVAAADAKAAQAAEADEEEELYVFKSPIVGTFYSSPKPDAEAFVRPGDKVRKGTPLCIVEAMKIFNQIDCDVDGVIESVLVENAQPVEFGEPLFKIRLT